MIAVSVVKNGDLFISVFDERYQEFCLKKTCKALDSAVAFDRTGDLFLAVNSSQNNWSLFKADDLNNLIAQFEAQSLDIVHSCDNAYQLLIMFVKNNELYYSLLNNGVVTNAKKIDLGCSVKSVKLIRGGTNRNVALACDVNDTVWLVPSDFNISADFGTHLSVVPTITTSEVANAFA